MPYATNSKTGKESSEVEEDGVETDFDEEEEIPVRRTHAMMQLRPTWSVWPVFCTSARGKNGSPNIFHGKDNLKQSKKEDLRKHIFKCKLCEKTIETKPTLDRHQPSHKSQAIQV